MQFDKANRLREANQGRSCDHPDIDKEYYLGSATGDYICTSCGHTFLSRSEWDRFREQLRDEAPEEKRNDKEL